MTSFEWGYSIIKACQTIIMWFQGINIAIVMSCHVPNDAGGK